MADPCLLEADQGDTLSGIMTRPDVADVIVQALSMPEAVSKVCIQGRHTFGLCIAPASRPWI